MNALFADTFFFLSLLRADDPAHRLAREHARRNRTLVTTEFILLELGNACARAVDHTDYLALVAGLRASHRTRIVPLDSALLNRGLQRMAARPDKDWSLTDCISFVVMEELGLTEALSGDEHFTQAGFRTLLRVP